jgi:xanthine dehydrogenase small subunit
MVTDASGSRSLNACILFLPQLQGKAVRTVEGISGPQGQLHPVQSAMITHHGSQCGFCTPGMLITAHGLLLHNANPDADQVRAAMSGNLCRCTGYAPIVAAVLQAAAHLRTQELAP